MMRPIALLAISLTLGCTDDPAASPLDGQQPPPELTLAVSSSVFAGQSMTLDATGTLGEGETVYFVVSPGSSRSGPCFDFLGNQCLGIPSPTLLASAQVDASGMASASVVVPNTVPAATPISFQAWVIRGFGGADSLGSNTADRTVDLFIEGCTDPNATNFDPNATADDGSCSFPGLYTFTNHTFTPCGASGRLGPTESACETAYASTGWASDDTLFGVDLGIQQWTVPSTGTYRIVARGSQGGETTASGVPGLGARVEGTFQLQQGEILQIVVGQRALSPILNSGVGGGGSFVVDSAGLPLLIAGGGSGATNSSMAGQGGRTTEAGGAASSGEAGGTNGMGGSATQTGTGNASGGGGFFGYGQTGDGGTFGTTGGRAFVNGANGGFAWDTTQRGHDGGFGGGGGCGNYGSGGGGGYSGGGAGNSNGDVGGGGGSFNAGSNPSAVAGDNAGMGSVTITRVP
jgi:hypothetical protein